MAKHAVPKKKMSDARRKSRHASFKKKVLTKLSNQVQLVDCSECGEKRLAHHACPACGKYRGRQVIDKQKEIDKITKIKA